MIIGCLSQKPLCKKQIEEVVAPTKYRGMRPPCLPTRNVPKSPTDSPSTLGSSSMDTMSMP